MSAPAVVGLDHERVAVRRGPEAQPRTVRLRGLARLQYGALAPGREVLRSVEEAATVLSQDLPGWGINLSGPQREAHDAVREAMCWALAGWDADEVGQWQKVGVATVFGVAAWTRFGASAQEAAEMQTHEAMIFVDAGRLPRERAWGRLWTVCPVGFAMVGRDSGQGPQSVEALATALTVSHGDGLDFLGDRVRVGGGHILPRVWGEAYEQAFAGFAIGIPAQCSWDEVALCLRAGMSQREAVRYVLDGRELDSVRLLAALAAPGQ